MVIGVPYGKVIVAPYSDRWPALFEQEKARIASALGPDAVEIMHVGSTAVPRLLAKPIIDINIGVADIGRIPEVVPKMEALGYTYKGEFGIKDRHFFILGEPVTHHVHIVQHGGDFWRVNVLFRDSLRTDTKTAEEYAKLKRNLAGQFPDDREMYTKSKNGFIQEALRKAGWRG